MKESNRIRVRALNEANSITTDRSMVIRPKRHPSTPQQNGTHPNCHQDQLGGDCSACVFIPTSSSTMRGQDARTYKEQKI